MSFMVQSFALSSAEYHHWC